MWYDGRIVKKKRIVTTRFVILCYVNIENNSKQFDFGSDSKHSKIFISQGGIIHYIDIELITWLQEWQNSNHDICSFIKSVATPTKPGGMQ